MQSIAILTTYPSSELAALVARKLLEAGLVACVNLVPAVRSLYRWEGEIADESEVLAIAKTTMAQFESVRELICRHHCYDCPEVIALPIEAGHGPYLQWIADSVRTTNPTVPGSSRANQSDEMT